VIKRFIKVGIVNGDPDMGLTLVEICWLEEIANKAVIDQTATHMLLGRENVNLNWRRGEESLREMYISDQTRMYHVWWVVVRVEIDY
jgi:hypothetical protein